MKKPMSITGLFSFFFLLQTAQSQDIYTFEHRGQSYEVIKEMKSWTDAAAHAVTAGGYLAQINDASEQTAIMNAIQNAGISTNYTSVSDGGGIAYLWIGATDKISEGSWIWDGTNKGSGDNFWNGQGDAGAGGGTAVAGAYINWGGSSQGSPKEPDDFFNNQDAAAIALEGWPKGTTLLGIRGEWNDIDISNLLYFVIEYDGSTGTIHNKRTNSGIYPNPTSSYIHVLSLNGDEILHISILNMMGKEMKSIQNPAAEELLIDLNPFPNGNYLIRISYKDKVHTEKFVLGR
jgi:hypothetical protein